MSQHQLTRMAVVIWSAVFLLAGTAFTYKGIDRAVNKYIGKSTAQVVSKVDTITLNRNNTIALTEGVSVDSMNRLSQDLFMTSTRLGKGKTIYLVINSTGGDVDAAKEFVLNAKTLPNKNPVKTITINSSSAAFHIVQALDERLILQHGKMFGHRMKSTIGLVEIPSAEFDAAIAELKADADYFDGVIALRMGLLLPEYRKMSKGEGYTAIGQTAVKERAADRVVYAQCDSSMQGTIVVILTNHANQQIMIDRPACPL